MEVQILPPKPSFQRTADNGRWTIFHYPLSAFHSSCTRGQIGKGAGLRNRILKVRVLPRVPTFSGDECKTSSKQPFKLFLAGSSPVVPSILISRMSNKGPCPWPSRFRASLVARFIRRTGSRMQLAPRKLRGRSQAAQGGGLQIRSSSVQIRSPAPDQFRVRDSSRNSQ